MLGQEKSTAACDINFSFNRVGATGLEKLDGFFGTLKT